VLPELGDPENLGSAFRNASAFGCSAIFLGPSGPDPLCRRVLRVSMGASLSLPWTRLSGPAELSSLAARGYSLVACVLDAEAADLRSWPRPERLALVLGNEAFGLSPPWLEACDAGLTLAMEGGTDSLNVATAAAVFLYALSSR
jgi:tRNA G18 (ribose-2'-O)-methylase SpoU